MKIYAIRDRMLDFFQQPFVGPNDKAVMASVAAHINNPEATDAIAQAPSHFELYELGLITEDGTLVANKAFICGCSSLIRPGVREGTSEPGRGGPGANPAGAKPGTPSGAPGQGGAT